MLLLYGGDTEICMSASSDNVATDWKTRCISLLLTDPGVGTRCMNPAYHTIPWDSLILFLIVFVCPGR